MIWDFQIPAFGQQKSPESRAFSCKYLFYIRRMAGAEGLEPSARGFGVDVEKTSAHIQQPDFRAVEPFMFSKDTSQKILMLY